MQFYSSQDVANCPPSLASSLLSLVLTCSLTLSLLTNWDIAEWHPEVTLMTYSTWGMRIPGTRSAIPISRVTMQTFLSPGCCPCNVKDVRSNLLDSVDERVEIGMNLSQSSYSILLHVVHFGLACCRQALSVSFNHVFIANTTEEDFELAIL